MSTHAICYDLNSHGQDYSELHAAIKKLGAWWHHLDSTWLLVTDLSAAQVRDRLKPLIDGNDELLVINITGDAMAWRGFKKSGSDWLHNNV